VQVVAGVLVIVAGAAQGAVGWLGWRGRLRRNRYLGVRTAATFASDDAFRLGNRVAAPMLLAAAAVAMLGGVTALVAPSVPAYSVVLAVAVLGMLGLAVAGGVLGSRAAASTAAPATATPTRGDTAPLTACAGCMCAGGQGTRGCLR
jgi:hypothetical protein